MFCSRWPGAKGLVTLYWHLVGGGVAAHLRARGRGPVARARDRPDISAQRVRPRRPRAARSRPGCTGQRLHDRAVRGHQALDPGPARLVRPPMRSGAGSASASARVDERRRLARSRPGRRRRRDARAGRGRRAAGAGAPARARSRHSPTARAAAVRTIQERSHKRVDHRVADEVAARAGGRAAAGGSGRRAGSARCARTARSRAPATPSDRRGRAPRARTRPCCGSASHRGRRGAPGVRAARGPWPCKRRRLSRGSAISGMARVGNGGRLAPRTLGDGQARHGLDVGRLRLAVALLVADRLHAAPGPGRGRPPRARGRCPPAARPARPGCSRGRAALRRSPRSR